MCQTLEITRDNSSTQKVLNMLSPTEKTTGAVQQREEAEVVPTTGLHLSPVQA